MRSKSVALTLLLASVALAACDDDTSSNGSQYGDGMSFESRADCIQNVGEENCPVDPVRTQTVTTTDASGVSHTSIIPIFMPSLGYHGGYLPTAPRAASSYVPSNPMFAAHPGAAAAARSGASFSSARGGFGSTSSSFSGASA